MLDPMEAYYYCYIAETNPLGEGEGTVDNNVTNIGTPNYALPRSPEFSDIKPPLLLLSFDSFQ